MADSIKRAYRSALKQIYRLKRQDPIVGDHFFSIVKMRRENRIGTRKQTAKDLNALTQLLSEANKGKKEAIRKIFRIWADQSSVLSKQLTFRSTYKSKAIKKLSQDIQFLSLKPNDRQFVQKLITRVCQNKPKVKHKEICDYLLDKNYQDFQKPIKLEDVESIGIILRSDSAYGLILKTISNKKHRPIEQWIEEFYENKLVLL